MESIYLNNGATSWPKPDCVARACADFLTNDRANLGRGAASNRDLSSLNRVFECRLALADLLGGWDGDPRLVTFTSNVSESLNVILHGFLKPGMTVVTTSMEHNSVSRPLTFLSRQGVTLRRVSCDAFGRLPVEDFEAALEGADLAVCTHASNLCGTLMPLEKMAALSRKKGVPLVIDGAQTVGHLPINVAELGLAALCFTGHKGLMGPQGTGGILWSPDFFPRVEPLIQGGTGSLSEDLNQPDVMPDKYETGTMNLPGLAGLAAAVQFVADLGYEALEKKDRALNCQMLELCRSVPGLRLYGLDQVQGRLPVFAFNIEGQDNADLAARLADEGVETRPGLHCTPWAHQTLGTFPFGALRLSPGWFTTEEELDEAFRRLKKVLRS